MYFQSWDAIVCFTWVKRFVLWAQRMLYFLIVFFLHRRCISYNSRNPVAFCTEKVIFLQYSASSRPATCRELYFGWTELCPEVVNTAVANVIKYSYSRGQGLFYSPTYRVETRCTQTDISKVWWNSWLWFSLENIGPLPLNWQSTESWLSFETFVTVV